MMEMKEYLITTFQFNDQANGKVLEKIAELQDKQECIRLFSHLINSQNRWLARIVEYPQDPAMSWWQPLYRYDELAAEWHKSLQSWLTYLQSKDESTLFQDVLFIGHDGGQWSAKLKDIVLQLNYHSIHHRAQIQWLIRAQGLKPDFIDYIGTVYKKIS